METNRAIEKVKERWRWRERGMERARREMVVERGRNREGYREMEEERVRDREGYRTMEVERNRGMERARERWRWRV